VTSPEDLAQTDLVKLLSTHTHEQASIAAPSTTICQS